jgi:hypothetical protein
MSLTTERKNWANASKQAAKKLNTKIKTQRKTLPPHVHRVYGGGDKPNQTRKKTKAKTNAQKNIVKNN